MVCVLGDRITKSLPCTAFGNAFLYFKAIFPSGLRPITTLNWEMVLLSVWLFSNMSHLVSVTWTTCLIVLLKYLKMGFFDIWKILAPVVWMTDA